VEAVFAPELIVSTAGVSNAFATSGAYGRMMHVAPDPSARRYSTSDFFTCHL